jgi:membrane protease subunit HflC
LCTITVYEGQYVVLKSFGKPVRIIKEPGLKFKPPYPFYTAVTFDSRLTILQPRPSEYLTADKKNLILESAICYRLKNPVLFMQTVRDTYGLEVRLTDLLSSHTGLLLGINELSQLVKIGAENAEFMQLNEDLTDRLRDDADKFGVVVEKVFIKRLMFPNENVQAVYDRMRAERDRIAKKYLVEGNETADTIRGEADKTARTILAEANNKAAIIRGKAEAEAMKIYGDAYKQNLPFYQYIRSLDAYENMFNEKTVIVFDEDSPVVETLLSGGQ